MTIIAKVECTDECVKTYENLGTIYKYDHRKPDYLSQSDSLDKRPKGGKGGVPHGTDYSGRVKGTSIQGRGANSWRQSSWTVARRKRGGEAEAEEDEDEEQEQEEGQSLRGTRQFPREGAQRAELQAISMDQSTLLLRHLHVHSR
jgi:hypothetical protein